MATVLERPLTGTHTGADRGLILDGGWAGDLVVCDGTTWIAWASCDDPEPPLLALINWQFPLRREAPLQPGVTPDDWRHVFTRTGFAVSRARLEGNGVASARVLGQSAHAFFRPGQRQFSQRHQPCGRPGRGATSSLNRPRTQRDT